MRKLAVFLLAFIVVLSGFVIWKNLNQNSPVSPVAESSTSELGDFRIGGRVLPEEYRNWKRPDGPLKVGLQVGHWKNEELPEELNRLEGNTGATGRGMSEWEVNYDIAQKTAEILKANNIEVDILPAAIPERYWADAFISIHADGHDDRSKTGFKASAPRRDFTGKANSLVELFREEYTLSTGLTWDEETITRNMRGYYAFAWWRFDHAVHPMTPSMIVETGFLSSPADQEIIIDNSDLAAEGLANAILKFLKPS